jgi:hypothetical protein
MSVTPVDRLRKSALLASILRASARRASRHRDLESATIGFLPGCSTSERGAEHDAREQIDRARYIDRAPSGG